MAAFVIFVGGAGTEPDPLPVFFVDSGEHAARICEGIEATKYRLYKFTSLEVSKSDLSKFPFWKEMTIDARDGVYGEVVAGIYDMIDRAYTIISQRRTHQESVANPNGNTHSDGDSFEPSSKPENQGETDDNSGIALARERLDVAAFREYLKEQILKWETWHQSQVDEIRMHESCRDQAKKQLENGIRQGTVDPDEPYVLSFEWHKYELASIPENLEFRLIADREPICFQEASIAAMVALFWCDINRSNMLVPDYDKQPDFDFFDPYGTFQKYLFEQWEKPIQGRYKRIDWFVEAAISAYQSRIAGGSVLPSTTKLPLIGDNVHLGMAELPGLTKLCTSLDQQHKPQGTLYRDEAGRFIYYVWDDGENSIGRTCQLVRPADAYEIVRNADEIHVDSVELFAEFEELQKQIAKEREVAFDNAISGYADSDWIGDATLNNKAWRVRSKNQTGELFGEGARERGWYQSKTEKILIKKDKEGVWVYLTESHSEELKEFFSAFVT
jgi:hypothetical protein